MKFDKIHSTTFPENEIPDLKEKIEIDNFKYYALDREVKEVDPSDIDLKVIGLWVKEISDYMKRLGVKKDLYIDQAQIHFIKDKSFFDDGRFFGFFDNERDNIYIDASLKKEFRLKTILHEMIHMFSFRSAMVEKAQFLKNKKIIEDYEIHWTRVGYDLGGDKFSSFNEALTEGLAQEIFHKNLKQIRKRTRLNTRNIYDNKNQSYYFERTILNILIDTLVKNNYSKDEVVENFLRGLFGGNMFNLRMVQKVYGSGFLKILANPEFIFENSNFLTQDYYDLFSIADKIKREDFIKNTLELRNPQRLKDKQYEIFTKMKIS